MKTNLFSRFRNLFRKSEADYEDSYEEGYEEYSEYSDVAVDEAGIAEESSEDAYSQSPVGDDLQMPQGAGVPTEQPAARGIHVPLAPIISGLPLELQSRALGEVGDASVFLSLERILPQLPTGIVSIAFGELRSAASALFSNNRDQDEVLINVPLSVILPHISPDMLARKHGPLQMEIPEEIVSPFADRGKGLAIGQMRQAPSAPIVPKATPRPSVPARPTLPGHQATPLPRPVVQPSAPISMPKATAPVARPTLPKQPAVPSATPPQAAANAAAKIPFNSIGGDDLGGDIFKKAVPSKSVPSAVSQAPATAPAIRPQNAPASAESHGPLQVGISTVADAWPEALKQEIIQLGLAQSNLAIPFELVEAGLKRGRLSFNWKTLKSWLNPAVESSVSIHDNADLELPLRVVAPLFIAQQKKKSQETPKVAVDKDIPNLFFGFPQPDTAGVAVDHAVNRPMDTNYYVWDDSNDVVADDEGGAAAARAATAGTEFISRVATPNEVVSRAAALDGVDGAVIALPDGLMVASQLPPGLNGDTLAAFLPHLFGKVTQCTQELRMGELNNLNFTVGNVPWKIFRVNALYFAAFGKKGQQMPTAQLAALAGELDHKAKV